MSAVVAARRELAFGYAAERRGLIAELWDQGLPTWLLHLLARATEPFDVLCVAALLQTFGHPRAADRLRACVLEVRPGDGR